ncbi:hypothetical protein SUGI_1126060 [Cryptomeria japonica]|uniref:putative UPF0481 protein At3g02645 n=1 Tax=Cryptomeria japonica TaxID=3369 RepID=UPI002414C8E7|nr:putative UPF0481 protein At3g02645 [Cryptomeria japonica]GLJ52858.1 hypothetical protein SUGI_1126060 [Cryptomeria japonica]
MTVTKLAASQWLEQIKKAQRHGEEQGKTSHVHPYIFTIPEPLRSERPEAYVPQVVSLGPYHHLKLDLYDSERYKTKLTIQVEKKAKQGVFEDLVKDLISLGGEIRNSYNDQIGCGDEVLGWMMARDAVFILEFIGCYDQCESPRIQQTNPNVTNIEAVFHPERKSPLFFPLQADIFKLENQIPLFILKKVLEWQTGSETQALNRLNMTISRACKNFSPFRHVGDSFRSVSGQRSSDSLEEMHILECLYNFVVPKRIPAQTSVHVEHDHDGIVLMNTAFKFLHLMTSRFRVLLSPKSNHKAGINLPSATELQRKGVKFSSFTWASDEIRFDSSSSTLFLPCIHIDYRTDVFLRNMMALEAFMKWKTRHFTCYADLMDRLVDTPNDVAVLKKNGIIYSNLGSDKEISILWNGISRSIWRSPYDPIDNTIKAVNDYYRSRYRVLFGEFVQEHFSKPWQVVSVVGACILLLLTFLQTLFSYFELHQKCEHKCS